MKKFILENKWPLIIGGIAVLLRLVYLIELSQWPQFAVPMIDEKWHWEWAHEIMQSSFWGEQSWFRAPLYPYFLAFLAAVTGSSIFWSKLLQTLLCVGTIFFTYRLANHLFSRTVAIVAGLIYAVYGTLIFYETMFLIPVLFLFFVVWGMYRFVVYFDSKVTVTWLLTGAIFGLAAIARPNVLLVIPFLILWKLIRSDRGTALGRRLIMPVIMLCGALAVVAPVTIRNLIVTGDFVLISSQGGINLYLGNNPNADGLTMLMPEVDLDESVSWRQFGVQTKAAAEQETGRSMTDAELSAFWTSRAVDFIAANPSHFLELVWKKCVYLVNGFENSDNVDIYYQRTKSALFSALVWYKLIYFPFGLLLPLFLLGAYLYRRNWIKLAPLYIFLIAYTPSIVLFLVTARHRLSLLPFLMILAAAGIVKLRDIVAQRKCLLLIAPIALLVISLVVLNGRYYDSGYLGESFQIHFNQGIANEQLGDLAGAEREYELAVSSFPYSAPILNNLAFVQYRLGKTVEAENNYLRAIDAQPDYPATYHNYAVLAVGNNLLDSALVLYQMALQRYDTATTATGDMIATHLGMADAFEQSQRPDGAAHSYRQAISLDDSRGDLLLRYSAFLARQGEYQTADSMFAAGQLLGEPTAGNWFNWGFSFMLRNRPADGIEKMHRALAADSSTYQASYAIAAASHQLGQPRDTVLKYLDLCFRYQSNYAPAVNLRNRLK